MSAAFALNRFHEVNGRGSKFLLPRVCLLPSLFAVFMGSTAVAANSCFPGCICCLRASQVSWGQRQRQQISASQGVFAAFALNRFHGVNGRGSKFLLLRHVCCLRSSQVSWGQWQRQQFPASQGVFVAFALRSFHGVNGRGSKFLLPRACLLPLY